MMLKEKDMDIEKGPHASDTTVDDSADGAVPGQSFEYGGSIYAKIQRLAGKMNIEQRGIERVPAEEQIDTSYFNIGSMVRPQILDHIVCALLTVTVARSQHGG